ESQLLSVSTSIIFPGNYRIGWGGLDRELVVRYPEETAAPNPAAVAPTVVTAPNFSGVDVVTGARITLSQFQDKTVLLIFVNYGCDPALNQKVGNQLIAIRDLAKQRSDFIPVSVFCGCCPPETLRKFARDNGLNWPWILDSDNSIVNRYASSLRKYGYPTLIFVDKDQVITAVAGYSNISTLNTRLDAMPK
ncbi:MAG: redoxin domain-containing protein, partial [Dehalococcoidales bacterium]|nr:redoxin domain-containing protein [Dehalococcoidales bacterium]